MGFINSKRDSSMFVRLADGDMFIVLVYVDDILITGSNGVLLTSLSLIFILSLHLKTWVSCTIFLALKWGMVQIVYTYLSINMSRTVRILWLG